MQNLDNIEVLDASFLYTVIVGVLFFHGINLRYIAWNLA